MIFFFFFFFCAFCTFLIHMHCVLQNTVHITKTSLCWMYLCAIFICQRYQMSWGPHRSIFDEFYLTWWIQSENLDHNSPRSNTSQGNDLTLANMVEWLSLDVVDRERWDSRLTTFSKILNFYFWFTGNRKEMEQKIKSIQTRIHQRDMFWRMTVLPFRWMYYGLYGFYLLHHFFWIAHVLVCQRVNMSKNSTSRILRRMQIQLG